MVKGQASAADLLIFALLVTGSVIILNIGPLTYQNNLELRAFEDRYTRDYLESALLTMKYASIGSVVAGSAEVKYTIGPFGGRFQGFVGDISDILQKIGFDSLPIERKVKGSMLDLMADDVVLNIRYDFNGDNDKGYIKLSQLMSKGYSEESEEIIKETFDAVLGDKFNYFVAVEYYPSEKPALKKFVYGLRTYTNQERLKDKTEGKSIPEMEKVLQEELKGVPGVKVVDFPITVSNDPDFLIEIIKKGLELFDYIWTDTIGATVSNFFLLGDYIEDKLNEAGIPGLGKKVTTAESETQAWFNEVRTEARNMGILNTRAKVRIYVWSKA